MRERLVLEELRRAEPEVGEPGVERVVAGADPLLGEARHARMHDRVVREGERAQLGPQHPRGERDGQSHDRERGERPEPPARRGTVVGVIGRRLGGRDLGGDDGVEDVNHRRPRDGAPVRAKSGCSSPFSSAPGGGAGAISPAGVRPQPDAAA
jgi:hypothetical protein